MSTYVLVHGSFHGGWCWEKIVPQLVKAGHHVVALDLPAHGEDQTPIAEVTLQSYVDTVVRVIDTRKEPVILVGHSFAGVVAGCVAEARPTMVQKIIYVSSIVLQNGQNAFALVDPNSQVAANLILNEAEGWGFVQQEAIPGIYYNDCSPEDVAAAIARLRVEPMLPYFTPVSLSEANFGSVPKFYVRCTLDNAVTPVMQEQIVAAIPMQQVFTLNTSHSPFLSAPVELANILLQLA